MNLQIYVIMEPGADRPYLSHTPPTNYQKKKGAKVYLVEAQLPDWAYVDGHTVAKIKDAC